MESVVLLFELSVVELLDESAQLDVPPLSASTEPLSLVFAPVVELASLVLLLDESDVVVVVATLDVPPLSAIEAPLSAVLPPA